VSLLLLFLSDEAATDDFCNLLTEDGGKLLTEAGEDIIGENCVPDVTPASTEGRPGQAYPASRGVVNLLGR
jgi:hypothetical protein